MNKTSCSLVTLYGRMPATQPSGQGSRNGIPRFFRRLAERVFDVDDLRFRTQELADVVTSAAQRYGFRNKSIVGVGYSNGANNASSLMLLYPHLLSGAVLFRPMVPFTMDFAPDLHRVHVLLAPSRRDPIVSHEQVEMLARMLEAAGAFSGTRADMNSGKTI